MVCAFIYFLEEQALSAFNAQSLHSGTSWVKLDHFSRHTCRYLTVHQRAAAHWLVNS